MRRESTFLICASLVVSIALSAHANGATITVASDDCPAPADIAPVKVSADLTGADLNSWADLGLDLRTVVDITVAQPPAANRVFQRYIVDPATGDIYGLDWLTGDLVPLGPEPCEEARAFGE